MQIVADLKYPTMYRIKWPDVSLSTDFYNRARAKEHLTRNNIENYIVGQTYNSPMAR